ncbi:MAG: ferritin-like domain-containing protein [Deltaproteobacteria bacterium]|nr:ferritin-like domain-containing protein [Deltaproteobacteria bacterium]MBW2413470.1 ferritin-like domain-containing protein [Deltaproteobacteria bacterium]
MADHITHDPIYNTLDRDNFMAMIEVDRYADRADTFDGIISSTVDHFWDPTDPVYIDFAHDFDMKNETILPREMTVEFNCAVADELDEGQLIRLANQSSRFMLSSILHGEQGALSLSSSLSMILRDPGAQEYATNQAREEARHVTGFSRYITQRWGTPLKCGPTLASLLDEVVRAPEVYKKLVGMQMLIEGLAMGAFATIHSQTQDPLLKKLVQLVMTDEAFHHKFGKIWADKTVPSLSEEEHEKVELWAAKCFQTLLFNLVNAEQKQEIYSEFGLEWQWVRKAVLEAFGDEDRRSSMTENTNIFRVLIKTLLKAGIITERTRGVYGQWVDMDELKAEDDEVVGTDLAEATMEELRDINRNRKKIGRNLRANA